MYIAIDIGGTNIRIAGAKELENPKFKFIKRVGINNLYEKDLQVISDELEKINSHILGISMGLPGVLNKGKVSAMLPNLNDWSGKKIKQDFEQILKAPVRLENDTVLAALGEGSYGTARMKDFIYLNWGTGVGGTRIKYEKNKLIYFPFEPGHDFVLEKDGREGSCGHKGDLECYVGGGSILKYYKKSPEKLSKKEWDEVVSYFVKGIKMILKKYPNNLLIFGGGVALGQPDKVNQIGRELQKEYPDLKIAISSLGDNAGLYGGLALLKMKLGNKI